MRGPRPGEEMQSHVTVIDAETPACLAPALALESKGKGSQRRFEGEENVPFDAHSGRLGTINCSIN